MESLMRRILNLQEWYRLEEEVEQLKDRPEREARERLMEGISEAIRAWDVHIREHMIKQILERGIRLVQVDRKAVVADWDTSFDRLVSPETKAATRNYSDQFRWHLFSFELLPALQGEEAREAFQAADRSTLYLFFDRAPEAFRLENAGLLTLEDMDDLRGLIPFDYWDVYLYDPVGKWTYITPHEALLGPYFFRAEG